MKIQLATGNASLDPSRIAAHSHIRSLGLDDARNPIPIHPAAGFIGQSDARLAASILVDLVRTKKYAGRALLLVGPPGTGKTAIAVGLARELGPRVPFRPMVASEVFSLEIKKTAVLAENFRRAIALRVKEVKEVYEGEVVELTPHEVADPLNAYSKTISHVMLKLRSAKGQKHLKLDPSIYDGLVRERVTVGDVIYIEAGSGAVKRVGRSDQYATEFDLEADEYVPVPKGDVHKKKEVIQDVTLHDLDMANARPEGGKDMISMVHKMMRPGRTEITEKLRREVNKAVDKYLSDGVAELTPGVLFIDEAHLLDLECFAYLNRALEDPRAPILVLATNRTLGPVRGAEDIMSPHHIPRDFLDRVLITATKPYSQDEIAEIVKVRAKAENIPLSESGVQRLADIGQGTSMRYVMGLLGPAKMVADVNARDQVFAEDVDEVCALFGDARRWNQPLQEQQQQLTQHGVYLA